MKKNYYKPKEKEKKIPQYRLDNMLMFMTSGLSCKKSIEHFADEQIKYFIEHPDEVQVTAYRLTRGVNKVTYCKWKIKNKHLEKLHNFLLEMLAHRRQTVLFKNNPNLITHTQYQYDEDWAEGEVRKDERKLKIIKHQAEVPTHIVFPSWHDVKTIDDAKKLFKDKSESDDS